MEGDLRAEFGADQVLELVCVYKRERERDWGKSGKEGDTENLI